MSGDTSTCGVHLEGALRFMTQARNWKTRFSSKARSLHRIYFYLQVIYQSTVVKQQNTISNERQALTFDVPGPLEVPLADIPDLAGVRQSATDQDLSSPGLQMSTYECIYGLPQNMLILLHKITTLIREVTAFRETSKTQLLSEDLSVRCNDVERTVMDWPIELELERCCIDGMGASTEIIRQTTYAFHNALIIYFAQNIRLMNYRYLQPYVETVLERIEAIERVKTESGILAAPLYWPCFIAASEAFNEPLQRRFKRWYEEGKVYGFEAVRSGTNVLSEVWAQGPASGNDLTSRWRMVVQEMDVHLMLS
jgi:arginine metabolism regulation protein II